MKKITCALLLSFPTILFGQQKMNYTVKGTLENVQKGLKVYLVWATDARGSYQVDSTTISKKNFSFQGPIQKPGKAVLIMDHQKRGFSLYKTEGMDILTLYLGGDTVQVEGIDSISTARITGSQVNVDYAQLLTKLAPIERRKDRLWKSIKDINLTAEEEAKNKKYYEHLEMDKRDVLIDFIKTHPHSVVSLDILQQLSGSPPDVDVAEPLFNLLSEEVKKWEVSKVYADLLRKLRTVHLGAIAPDFSQNSIDGKNVTLSSFIRGRYVLLDFWASWCGPCREENPTIVKAYNQFKNKKFTVLGVSLDMDKSSWRKAIESDGLTWTHISDLKGWQNKVAKLYYIRAIPQNFLLDPEGRIIAKQLHGEALIQRLQEIFPTNE